ncbi:MAG: hypothetical protein H6732_02910 [Alphaproteobacteria bacterium]|nr:hypothetical protein [Alphaproteobacteria bacterium]
MDWPSVSLGNLLCLLTGFALPFLLLAVAARRGMRPLAAASAYRNVAWKLGLEADTRGTSIQGHLDRRRLFVGTVDGATRRGRRTPEVRALLDLSTPLGLGLDVRRVDGRLTRWRRGRAGEITVGDPTLDDAIAVRAAEADRARTLFTDGVRDALEDLLGRTAEVQLTDDGIQARLRRPPPSDRALTELVASLRRLAEALEQARAAMPAPAALTHLIPAWGALAGELGLVLDPGRPALHGTLGEVEVHVVPVRQGAGWCADVRAWLPPHPPTGLRVWPEDHRRPLRRHGQDIALGDPVFDEAFVVQGYDPRVIVQILGPEARRALLALAEEVPLRLTDAALEVQQAPLDPERLGTVVRGVVATASALRW